MFTKSNNPSNTMEVHNVLSLETEVTGNISTKDDMRLDGSIKGQIQSDKKLVVGEKAVVEGNIRCANLDSLGLITGDIHCEDKVILRAASRTVGNIYTKSLEIESGALFEGSCKMNSAQQLKTEE